MNPVVRIVEVGPRDGLQNEKTPVSTEVKEAFVRHLFDAGLKEVEATSFVSPKAVPQLADSSELMALLGDLREQVIVLVPNKKGLERALEAGAKRIALFTAASDAFTQRNINMSIDESLDLFAKLVPEFRKRVPDGFVRGYISTIVECPFAGSVLPESVTRVADRLDRMGVDEVSLGETLGVAVPDEVAAVARSIENVIPPAHVSWHFHDTRGTALANVFTLIERGYRSFDASAGGLGGCPFAPGAGGNLATEDLVYAMDRAGYSTGINLEALARASLPVLEALGLPVRSRAQQAVLASACN